LWTWRTAWSWRHLHPVTAVLIGSSNSHGVYGTGYLSSVERNMASALSNRLGGGTSYLGDHPGWTLTGTTSVANVGLSRFSRQLSPGASMARTAPRCERFSVQFKQGAGSGVFTVAIDGGPAVTVTPDTSGTSERYDGTWTSGELVPGPHSIKITAVGTATIMGVQAESGAVRVVNAAHGGTSAKLYADVSAAMRTHNRAVGSVSPSLLVMMVGSNDYAGLNAPQDAAAYAANLRRAVQRARAACPTPPSVLLVHQHRRWDVANPPSSWEAFGQALQQVAADLPDCAALDVSGAFPTGPECDVDQLVGPDGVHLTERGAALLADLIGDALLGHLPPPSTAPAQPEPDPAALPGLLAAWRAGDLTGTDGSPVVAWTPYAGTEASPLLSVASPAVLRHRAHTIHRAVDTAGSRPLQTGPWSTTHTGPITVLAVARAGTATVSGSGHLWSGRAGTYVTAQLAADNILALGAGGLSAPASAWVYAGTQGWAVYGAVYDGANSALYTHNCDPVSVSLAHGSAYGLPGFTLGAGSSGNGQFASAQYAEVIVYGRALTPAEATSAVAALARRYALDGSGRTST
jgi:lysophospholipase L1-like esterase